MYRQLKDTHGEVRTDAIKRTSDCATIPCDPMNRDYADYLAWVAEGNTILSAE